MDVNERASHLPKNMIKIPCKRELIDPLATMYDNRNGGVRFWVCKRGADSENTDGFFPKDSEI